MRVPHLNTKFFTEVHVSTIFTNSFELKDFKIFLAVSKTADHNSVFSFFTIGHFRYIKIRTWLRG